MFPKQNVNEPLESFLRRNPVDPVSNIAVLFTLVVNRKHNRVIKIFLCKLADFRGHCRREKPSPSFRDRVKDRFKLLAESHIEHQVALIEYNAVNVVGLQCPPLNVVADSSGCSCDYSRAVLQGFELGYDVHSADERGT